MLKRCVLLGLASALLSLPALAAEAPSKPAPAPAAAAKPSASDDKVAASEATKVSRKKARWSNPNLDLTHCLQKPSNTEIIRCAEA